MTGCDEVPPFVQVGGSGDDAAGCFSDVVVAPADGAGPLHRMTPLAVAWRGEGDVGFDVRANGVPVSGETWVDQGRAVFVPHGALPSNALIEWRMTACDKSETGAFKTGALLHPFENVEQCVNDRYEVDLRAATLATPATGTTLGDVVLKWRIAPAMLLMAFSVTDDRISYVLAPAKPDANGVMEADASLPWQMVSGSLAENPYVLLQPRDFAVGLGDGDLVLRDVELLLGIGEDGLEDGRLAAVVDTRNVPAASDPCGAVEAMTNDKCFPCDETDRAASCFLLEMQDVMGSPTDVHVLRALPRRDLMPVPAAPCSGADCADAREVPAPAKPAPLEPRFPCPDGFCPERPVPQAR